MFNGLCADLNDISKLSFAKTRSVCPENFTGEKGKAGMAETGTGASYARDLGRGWKISPSVPVKAHETFTLCDIQAEGAIKHFWLTGATDCWRWLILRVYGTTAIFRQWNVLSVTSSARRTRKFTLRSTLLRSASIRRLV